MRIAVIADDLTGASDCGGQLVHYGLQVSVVLGRREPNPLPNEAVILNTDSRSLSGEEAYRTVQEACRQIRNEPFDVLYKKMDSTMRGNVGQEINAVYDVFEPDFVIIAPAYIGNGRQVIDGIHYVNGIKLHETEAAHDPKTPVQESRLVKLIGDQAQRKVGHLSRADLEQGTEHIAARMAAFKEQQIAYIVADSTTEAHMEAIVKHITPLSYSVIWAGSSGLIRYLPQAYGLSRVHTGEVLPRSEKPVLLVVGSVSPAGRRQLERVLQVTGVTGIEMDAVRVISGEADMEAEMERLRRLADDALGKNRHVVLFSSDKVEETRRAGQRFGFGPVEISNRISMALGKCAAELVTRHGLQHLFLTGGDTAHQVFQRLNLHEFRLLSEVENGIPLGKLSGEQDIFAVTKAGNFGSEAVMEKAVLKLQGGAL
ncbi:hypothetical protein EHV15_20730 [Paenibacillus oralis]|uniref:Four-carbon acid sugar kinase family protein n=1 Tax=Paenibacillus oralis TaxID=2490856 RepID=A0A3P3U9E0_9BACL|nr:four-carbon acid sugar kinase family protein [Paenibacillus oralis]RRJ65073.1 hypothetical protein EHV15_20730 [Paenibacillus oralis]